MSDLQDGFADELRDPAFARASALATARLGFLVVLLRRVKGLTYPPEVIVRMLGVASERMHWTGDQAQRVLRVFCRPTNDHGLREIIACMTATAVDTSALMSAVPPTGQPRPVVPPSDLLSPDPIEQCHYRTENAYARFVLRLRDYRVSRSDNTDRVLDALATRLAEREETTGRDGRRRNMVRIVAFEDGTWHPTFAWTVTYVDILLNTDVSPTVQWLGRMTEAARATH